jgi:hypothetical protein
MEGMKRTMERCRGGLVAVVLSMHAASVPMAAAMPAAAGPTVEVALTVGGANYTAKGPGECIHSDASTIYEAPATQWGVRHDSAGHDLSFSMWRLRSGGPDMLTLTIVVGGKTHRVNTTKVGDKSAGLRGSGRTVFEKSGAGGVFTIDAIADTGAKISGRVTCSGFAKPEDNG